MKYATHLPESVLTKLTEKPVPWGPVGYPVYKRTYAQRLYPENKDSPKEEFIDTLRRVINGILTIGGAFTHEELETLAYYFYNLKCLPSGRGLWQLGMPTVARIGGDSLQACWHVKMEGPIDPFCFTLEELMLGGGMGFNILPEVVYSMPEVKYSPTVVRTSDCDCDLIVTDNREGWVELLRKVLTSFFFTGKDIYYNTDCIRDKGAPIRSFGGTASGPEDLVNGLAEICKILNRRHRQKLRPINVLDIQNILAMIVVAGNVRRSAQIACGSGQDREFLNAKMWSLGSIPRWRQQSNNTCIESNIRNLHPDFWKGYETDPATGYPYGEAYGLFNPTVSANYGRLADGLNYRPDPRISGPNPCGEITLEDRECCNLGELFLVNLQDEGEFHVAAELMNKVQKTISCLPFLNEKTNQVVKENHRLGTGVTGFTAAHHLRDPRIFNQVYRHIEETDRKYSKLLGVKESIKLTTVKPSGTLSKLARGCPPGANAAYALHQILRVTFASDNPMVEEYRRAGYRVEVKQNIDGSLDYGSMLVVFPIKYPDGTATDATTSALQQMENQRFLQTHWADNSVSMTVQYNEDEWPGCRNYLEEHYDDHIKAISFSRHAHGFKQAPNEEITPEEYHRYSSSLRPVNGYSAYEDAPVSELECTQGTCGVR